MYAWTYSGRWGKIWKANRYLGTVSRIRTNCRPNTKKNPMSGTVLVYDVVWCLRDQLKSGSASFILGTESLGIFTQYVFIKIDKKKNIYFFAFKPIILFVFLFEVVKLSTRSTLLVERNETHATHIRPWSLRGALLQNGYPSPPQK